jgi:Phage integrase, N-terminal SAM-like domain
MSPLRVRMIQDMRLAGLATSTQAVYIRSVCSLAAHYRRSPDTLSEEEVRSYLVGLRERGLARGSFKVNHYGIQFLYRHTLDREWPLFSKKRFASRSRGVCRSHSATPRFAACSTMSGTRPTRPASP